MKNILHFIVIAKIQAEIEFLGSRARILNIAVRSRDEWKKSQQYIFRHCYTGKLLYRGIC